MKLSKRGWVYLIAATAVLVLHLVIAALAKTTFTRTMFGDSLPCTLFLIALLACRENIRKGPGVLPLFWKFMCAGLGTMVVSEMYWFYYDAQRVHANPSPIVGDVLFLLAYVFMLFAVALQPHAASAGRAMRLRRLDLLLLTLWWFTLYGYIALPWQSVIRDFAKYNPAYYMLNFVLHLALITAVIYFYFRNRGVWRAFYGTLLLTFILVAGGSLLLEVAIDHGTYNSGGFSDTTILLGAYFFTIIALQGAGLEPVEDFTRNLELKQTLWTASLAMIAILSLPVMGFVGHFERNVPAAVALLRLRVVFVGIFVLGALVFWKLHLLTRELVRFVNLSHASIGNLKTVQAQVTQSQKYAALGRLAAGAAHEISNPLTAILGYSELLSDISSLSPEDRASAKAIQAQVHRAQAAVNSLRSSLRSPASADSLIGGKAPDA